MIGIAIAAPVGPISMLCIPKTLELGLVGALVVGLGAAIVDSVYGVIAVTGLSALSDFLLEKTVVIKIVVVLIMIYKGVLKLGGLLLLLLLMTGCGKKYADSTVRENEFIKVKKTIFIAKIVHQYKGLIFKGEETVQYSFSKVDKRYPDKKLRHEYRGALEVFMQYRLTLDGLNRGREDFLKQSGTWLTTYSRQLLVDSENQG